MSIAQALLPEFDHEMKTTRSVLERIPDAKATFRPHPKSTALGQLGAHLAQHSGMGHHGPDPDGVR